MSPPVSIDIFNTATQQRVAKYTLDPPLIGSPRASNELAARAWNYAVQDGFVNANERATHWIKILWPNSSYHGSNSPDLERHSLDKPNTTGIDNNV
jgi:hypothetical protein